MRSLAILTALLTGLGAMAQDGRPLAPPPKTNVIRFMRPAPPDSLFSREVVRFGDKTFYQYSIRTPDRKPLFQFSDQDLVFYINGKRYSAAEAKALPATFLADAATPYGMGRGRDFVMGSEQPAPGQPLVWFGVPPKFSDAYLAAERFRSRYMNKTVAGVVTRYTGGGFILQTLTDSVRVMVPEEEVKRLRRHLGPGDVVTVDVRSVNIDEVSGAHMIYPWKLDKDGDALIIRGSVQVDF